MDGPTGASSRGEHPPEKLRAGAGQHVGLANSGHRLLAAEAAAHEAMPDNYFEFCDICLWGDIDHRPQRRGASDAVNGRDVRIRYVLVADDDVLTADDNVFRQTTVGIDVGRWAWVFAWHGRKAIGDSVGVSDVF